MCVVLLCGDLFIVASHFGLALRRSTVQEYGKPQRSLSERRRSPCLVHARGDGLTFIAELFENTFVIERHHFHALAKERWPISQRLFGHLATVYFA